MKIIRKILIVIEILILLALASFGGWWLFETIQGRLEYNIPAGTVNVYWPDFAEGNMTENSSDTISLTSPDMKSLKAQYPNIVCWIQIPDTIVDYPVVQGDNDSYWLNHLYTGKKNSNGSIFLHSGIKDGLDDKNALIFGHNMKSGAMFAVLNKYHDQSFYNEHQYVYITDLNNNIYVYRIFSVYEATPTSGLFRYGFDSNDSFSNYLEQIQQHAEYETGVEVTPDDRIITLSTCIGGHKVRTLAHAVLLYTVPGEQSS